MVLIVDVVDKTLEWIWLVWVVSVSVARYSNKSRLRAFGSELRPLAACFPTVEVFDDALKGALLGHMGWLVAGLDVLNFVAYIIVKKDTDDRWKKRRRKTLDKIKALASGRLAVASQGA